MISNTEESDLQSIDTLDDEHKVPFRRALGNLLSTDRAEYTYAQIIDGLPTRESFKEGYHVVQGHPVFELNHTQICPGSIDKIRKFRAQLDYSSLRFQKHLNAFTTQLLYAFNDTTVGSRGFHLRFIELVVVACHQLAVHLYNLDDGAHKHEVVDTWLQQHRMESVLNRAARIFPGTYYLPPTAFFHRFYTHYEQYPCGVADVVGYWAEGMIFGGVVVFDRGETEQECNAMWLHGHRAGGPTTLYPPTPTQFESLMDFLLSSPNQDTPCPLPIHGTDDNRPRWHPYHALAQYHIFRDKYERKLPPEPPQRRGHRMYPMDWPELGDEWLIHNQAWIRNEGHELSEADIAAARTRLKEVTPSSPCWHGGAWPPD
ncbi:hypothetical protein F66182_10207 [Fusarium sp. NRRL 66182]|nr:hypothetical protein F66182_10207 [Fusarium sp. NRRL 66182]